MKIYDMQDIPKWEKSIHTWAWHTSPFVRELNKCAHYCSPLKYVRQRYHAFIYLHMGYGISDSDSLGFEWYWSMHAKQVQIRHSLQDYGCQHIKYELNIGLTIFVSIPEMVAKKNSVYISISTYGYGSLTDTDHI